MKLEYRDGLLFTTLDITYKGKSKTIDKIVIDTGAAESIISPDCIEELGIYAEQGDKIISYYGVGGTLHNAYEKKVDFIKFSRASISDVKIDFGLIDPRGDINGLIGLDLLIKVKAIIDLMNMTINVKNDKTL